MKHPLRYALAALTGLAACHRDVTLGLVPAVTNTPLYDVLGKGVGYWQWERTTCFKGVYDSARVGYGRQLVFRNDSTLLIHRTNRADTAVTYHLSAGVTAACGRGVFPIVRYSITEAHLIPNNSRRVYTVQGTRKVLAIVGEYNCVDDGAYESYHWVAQ